MASETVIPEQTTPEVQKMVNEEIKTVEEVVVPVSKGKEEDVLEGKPKNEKLASPEAIAVVSAVKTEDKEVEPLAVVAAEKIDSVPVLDVEIDAPKSVEDVHATQDVSVVESVEKEPEQQPKISDAPVAEVESVDKLVEEVLVTPVAEEVPVTKAGVEVVEKAVEEVAVTPKPEEVPAQVAEVDTVEKQVEEVALVPEPEEVPAPVAEVEAAIDKVVPTVEPVEVQVSESKIVEKPESVIEVDEKVAEKSEVIAEVETKPEVVEPQESVVEEIAKQAETLVTEPLAEEVSVTPDVVASVPVEDTKKETPVDVVETFESLVKEAASEMPNVEGEENVVKVETGNEVKKEEAGESKEPETDKSENIAGSNSATGVTEKSSDGDKASVDDEVVPAENKEESVKDVVKASTETSKDLEEKLNVVDSTTTTAAAAVNEPVGEPKELVLEAKTKDTVETGVEKLESAAEVVEEITKSDAPNLESSKDVAVAKTEGDLPKQEVPAKTAPKHSNNIMSKVKQSIVKVKKAIIGKSPSSKTITSDAKDDIQVK